MRPSHVSGASNSCSCTSCTYKSDSERPSIRRIIAGGSRIDKLYYGKYIPLREQKLLDKLVRTRAVYDDIRNQILSDSDVSIKEKANLKPRKHVKARPKEMAATDKSSAILELVDLVDKGKVSGGKTLSECCSCCSCGSKLPHTHTHEHTSQMRRHRHRHGHAHGGRGGAYTMSRTSMIRKKIGEVRRNVRFKAKSISSAPCTCTSKISGMIKRQSQEIIKRLRPEGSNVMLEQIQLETYDQNARGQRKRIIQKTYQKMKKSKTRLMQSMGEGARKVKESRTRLKEHIEAEGKKSLEKIKHAKNAVTQNVKSVVRKSIRRRQPPAEELNIDEFTFPIKKDSITKFKERLQRKKLQDYYACEPGVCIPDECLPQDCFKIIKLRRIRRGKKEKINRDSVGVEKNIGVTSSTSSVAVQAQQKGTVGVTETENKQKKVIKRRRPSAEQRISVDVGIKKTGIEPRVTVTKSPKGDNKPNIRCACEEVNLKEPPKETMAVKSKTSLPPTSGQQDSLKPNKSQQESPSVRLGIEIRKNKAMAKKEPQKETTSARQIYTKKHGHTELEKSSQTKILRSIKEAQTGSHALKRCFCTLKLKAKRYRSKPTISSSKSTITATRSTTTTRKVDQMDKFVKERVQTKRLKHHELECIECLSDKCDPRDCIKNKKRRPITTGVNVKPRHKSVSSFTSKSLSTGSIMTLAPKKVDEIKKHSSSSSRQLDQLEENSSQRQAVRIGSTFSFSIEFYKDKPENDTLERSQEKVTEDLVKKRNRSTNKRKHLRHRHSQISSSTGKSKYTLTKHSLRRCFCTLKLAHADKKIKAMTRSQGSATSLYTSDVTVNVNKAIATDKKYNKPDTFAIQKRINTRQIKYHIKQSNTDSNRRTKSTSSLTSKSIPNRTKKVQSTTTTYGTPSKKHKDKAKTLRQIRTTPSSPERQVVRIASSFSFNVEFYKDNHDKISSPSPINNSPQPPSKSSEILGKPKKDRGYQEKVKKRQKSTSMLVKKKNRGSFIAPAMKKCFCTLKLQKSKESKQKKVIQQATTGTETPVKNVMDYKNVMITKGTKTKQEKHKLEYALEPYECEPYVCVPGQCDPYECLKRIQMRQLKESGTLTDKAKMKSTTSLTYKSKLRSKGALTKANNKPKKVLTNIKNDGGDADMEKRSQRQAVRLGSAFSFSIEFNKDMPVNTIHENITDVKEFKVPKKLKHRSSRTREASSSHQNTQVARIKQAHKAAGIRPMLKRCFCTLKLQGKKDQKVKTNIKAPKVITVSRVTVTETKITDDETLGIVPAKYTSRGLNWAAAMYNINSSSTVSKSSVVFEYKEMKSYFHNQTRLNSITSNSLSDQVLKASPCNMLVYSNLILPTRTKFTNVNNKFACSENCLLRRTNTEKRNLQKRKQILKCKGMHLTSKISGNFSDPHTNDRGQQQSKSMGYNHISSQHYYAMNVQVPHRNKNTAKRPVQYKLKPYECEPGICVPDECDPYECEKLIKKRLMKRVDRMSGTNSRSKSISSYASQSTSNSKTKKLQSGRSPSAKVKKVAASGIKYETVPHRNHKQAVRVGSSFSFNIEFSKGQSSPDKNTPRTPNPSKAHKPTKPAKKIVNSKGTTGYGVDHHDQDSQSLTLTENKGSGMKPMMQKCFCTLKLQKKGKNQKIKKVKPIQHAFDKGTRTPPNTLKSFVDSRTMINAGQNTANQKPYKLLPYECEPNVCIPGECNPYECFERIKQRNKKIKDSGTEAMRYRTSSSSNTRQRTRTQEKHIQSKPRRYQKSRESTASRSSNIVSYQAKPSRQAVRVGSSFSFNVEFFKENSKISTSNQPTTVLQRESKQSVETRRVPKQKVPKKKVRVVGLQSDKTYKHRTSQMGAVLNQVKSTMTTSFIKRCFCTAKLHGKGKGHQQEKLKPTINQTMSVDSKASQANETKSFLNRCLCVLKLKRAEKKQKQKKVQANNKTKIISAPIPVDKKVVSNLEPYECEPGICVPGECNPYDCLKLIKARNVKLDTREVLTDRSRTRSTSSSFKSSKTSKARRTQSNFRSPSTISKQQSTKFVKESPSNAESFRPSSNRQVVRIGSNFSFNIEFYKDRSPNTEEVQAAAKAVRLKPPRPEPNIHHVKTGKDHKTRNKGSVGNSVATGDRESQVNKPKVENRASGIAPALKRCFCTLKLQKHNIPTAKYTTQKTGTGAMKEIPTLQNRSVMTTGKNLKLQPYECEPHVCIPYECDPYECEKLIKIRNSKKTTKSVMTTNKEKPIGYKLLPYECEPNFCIPGQCDPYKCEKRIQLRNIKHKTSGTSTKKYRGKSISSDMRSTVGSKARKVQSHRIRDRRRSKSVSSKPYRTKPYSSKKSLYSTRQSVKIGSGFSFDIEFYKSKASSKPEIQVRTVKQREKRTNSISSSARQRLPSTKNYKTQYSRSMRDTDSQILAKKMRDTGVNPFLKRCFCTLKLQKSREMASKHAIGRAARDKNVYFATLLPYECEPGICVPGQCDPYECDKRIKRRQMRSQLAGTDRKSRNSSTCSTDSKCKAAKNQAMRDTKPQKHQKATFAARDFKEHHRPTLSSQSSSRQAVRIGSSFKFDVEFYKDKSPKFEERPRTHSRPVKKFENIKTKPIKTHTRSRSVTSSDTKRLNNKLQTKGSKTESKSTGVGPLLKRCFCTLALHKKKSPPVSKTKATYRNDDLSDLYQFSRNVGVGTSKKHHKLKPYECEPNVCIPGQCDPYECYERIKRRLKDSGTETMKPTKKHASIITSKQAKATSANTQAIKCKPCRERSSMTSTMRERVRTQHAPRYSKPSGKANRQAVKIGSNFSFSVEFFKERPNAIKIPKTVYKIKDSDEKRKIYKTSKTSPSQKKNVSRPSHIGSKGYDQKCQADCVRNTSRGTTMGDILKRCFCTLNLYKNSPRQTSSQKKIVPSVTKESKVKNISAKQKHVPSVTKQPNVNNISAKQKKAPSVTKQPNVKNNSAKQKNAPSATKDPNVKNIPTKQKSVPPDTKQPKVKNTPAPPDLTKPAMAQTKEKYTDRKTLSYKLKPYECEPNICVPGQCDPYECLERMKNKNIRRYSRKTGTHIRSSKVSVSSMASRLRTSRHVQSGVKRVRNVSHSTQQQVPRVVEEPRFAHMFDSSNRTGVKIGSNISFNIEFYKDKSDVPTSDDYKQDYDYSPKEPKLKQIPRKSTFSESKPKGIHIGTGRKHCGRRSCVSQADSGVMKNKATGVNNVLKRCFCTLKLQKNAMKPPKVITVNRVAIEENYTMGYMREGKRKISNNHPNPPSLPFYSNNEYYDHLIKQNNSIYRRKTWGKNNKICCHENNITRPFNESKEMKTLFPYTPTKFNKNVSNTVLLRKADAHKKNFIEKYYSCNQSLAMVRMEPKRQGGFAKKAPSPQGQTQKGSVKRFLIKSNGKIFLHKLFARLFLKRSSKNKQIEEKNGIREPNRNLRPLNLDTLKSSKSDRRATNVIKIKAPKKTTSLKVTRISDRTRTRGREEKHEYQNHRKFSNYQSGDIGQEYSFTNRHLTKALSSEYKNLYSLNLQKIKNKNKLTRSPYESDKIVQMAILKSSKSKKASKNMVNTTTNTIIKKTRTKSVETKDNPNNNKKFLNKCKCFIDKIISKKDISIKDKTPDDNNELKTDERKKKVVYFSAGEGKVIAVIDRNNPGPTTCPCPGKKRRNLSSGDNQNGQQEKTVKTIKMKDKTFKERKKCDKALCEAKKQKKKSLQSGDAPDNIENIKSKPGKIKATKIKKDEIGKFGHTTKDKKSKRTSQLPMGEPVEDEALEMTKPDKRRKIKNKNAKSSLKTTAKMSMNVTAACKHATPCPCCKKRVVKLAELDGTIPGKEKNRVGVIDKHKKYNDPLGAKITIKAKGERNIWGIDGRAHKPLGAPDDKPCVCKSKVCDKESKKMKKIQNIKSKQTVESTQPCICGSEVCANEAKRRVIVRTEDGSKKEQTLLCECNEMTQKAKKMSKEKEDAEKKKKENEKLILKNYKKEDDKRKLERQKAEKLLAKQAQQYKNSPDRVLAAESLLDMLKLCTTTGSDLLRCSSRALMHPRMTYRNLQELAKNPSRGLTSIGDAVQGSGVCSTCNRVRQRCVAMRAMQSLKTKMESNWITYFLLHATDKDPKKRMGFRKRKHMKRRREPIDFECSLFMASLRRKPCLAVYYTCPWFYPHCLSMLTLWKQFTDVMLFLIAVTVWSPCIVGMEICRAFICCFFCTG